MTFENRCLNLRLELEQARRCLTASRLLLTNRLYADAVSRAYYAMLHAARALLLTEGLEARSHRGVGTLLHQHFIHSQRFPAELGRELSRCQDDREAADYDRFAVFEPDMGKRSVQLAEEFLGQCERLIQAGGFPLE